MLQKCRLLSPGELLNQCRETIGYAMEENERGTAMTTSNHARLAAESAEERKGGGGGDSS